MNSIPGRRSEGRPRSGILDIFNKPYNPTETEDRIYKFWEESGFFNPDRLPERHQAGEPSGKPFSIVLPPPNVTGTLHAGHALTIAIEDIMVRHARMKGRKTLWIPGTDHAAIATQAKVEKDIEKSEGKRRKDFSREEFIARVDAFAAQSHETIVNQIRKLGASVDWSREAFTLDEKRNLAVRTAFKKMYDDGLIERDYRVVNWDPKGQTTISDDEIVYETRKTKLYTFKYSKDIPISISTTRPETKLGDTGIAVHPGDERYARFIGQEFTATFAGKVIKLKVVADESVEKDFGTGALGVTPAHSSIDWEIAQRHSLALDPVIDEYGRMTVGLNTIKGKKTTEAREAVVEWLKSEGLLEKEEEVEQNISLAERTGGVIEPLPKLQWFVRVNKKFKDAKGREVSLKELMKEAVLSGATTIIPDQFERVYFHWIENLRDWCISRQIWYGHRVPVWYKGTEIHVGVEAPTGEGWTQDEDTLDTWFSSGLWTFSTLGWPDEKEFAAQRQFHPTTVLETGRDIIFFWVARMILMSTYVLGEVPFKTVYLHGLVLDGKGKKMSKSLGNFVDPLEVIAKYGADAYRMSLVVGVGPGSDSKVGEDKVKAYKLFANKLWNITRFVLENTGGEKLEADFAGYVPGDTKLRSEFQGLMGEISKEMDEYKFYLVAEKLYHYAWHEFADKILEDSKRIFLEGDAAAQKSRRQLLLGTLDGLLRVLHPFMPYVTEEIWQVMGGARGGDDGNGLLMVEDWPV